MGDDKKTHRTWSITENFESLEEPPPPGTAMVCGVPGWKLTGQWERGENNTVHFQGMLKTPPVKFAAVKREFPRAHIEPARNEAALAAYTSKTDTRIATYESNPVPNMFNFQTQVSDRWDWEVFRGIYQVKLTNVEVKSDIINIGDLALNYLDDIVSEMIEEGSIGLEFIAINPMWRSSWKRFWRAILKRNKNAANVITNAPPISPSSSQAESELCSDGGEEAPSSQEVRSKNSINEVD